MKWLSFSAEKRFRVLTHLELRPCPDLALQPEHITASFLSRRGSVN